MFNTVLIAFSEMCVIDSGFLEMRFGTNQFTSLILNRYLLDDSNHSSTECIMKESFLSMEVSIPITLYYFACLKCRKVIAVIKF